MKEPYRASGCWGPQRFDTFAAKRLPVKENREGRAFPTLRRLRRFRGRRPRPLLAAYCPIQKPSTLQNSFVTGS